MNLDEALLAHSPSDAKEAADLRRILDFVARHCEPFDRHIREGHLTGSALVVSTDGRSVLLVHHTKLDRWLQPGGHDDPGECTGEAVALREALEETGIEGLTLHPTAPRPLDVDVHDIPARGDVPAHQHLDLRYLVLAPPNATVRRCETETRDMRWVAWDDIETLGPDHGLLRAFRKARSLCTA